MATSKPHCNWCGMEVTREAFMHKVHIGPNAFNNLEHEALLCSSCRNYIVTLFNDERKERGEQPRP